MRLAVEALLQVLTHTPATPTVAALSKRHSQGWVQEVITTLPKLIARIRRARADKKAVSIGYYGNVVDVWRALAEDDSGEPLVDLGSDQTYS